MRYRHFCLVFMVLIFVSTWSTIGSAQGLPMATATITCGAPDDDDRLERMLTGVFSRADSILFNGACDHASVIDTVVTQELVDVVAISGPRAQVIAEVESVIDISPDSSCGPDGRTVGFGFTEGRGILTFSVALSEMRPPPFRPSVVPGRAILTGTAIATVELPNASSDIFGEGEEPNAAYADIGFIFGGSNLIASRAVESTNGTEQASIMNEEFSLDLLTNGDRMEFTKFANVEVQSSTAPLCANSDRARTRAFAAIDPIIEFDQAAFDTLNGANSYNLSEYFQLNTSANLNDLIQQDSFEGGPPPVF